MSVAEASPALMINAATNDAAVAALSGCMGKLGDAPSASIEGIPVWKRAFDVVSALLLLVFFLFSLSWQHSLRWMAAQSSFDKIA